MEQRSSAWASRALVLLIATAGVTLSACGLTQSSSAPTSSSVIPTSHPPISYGGPVALDVQSSYSNYLGSEWSCTRSASPSMVNGSEVYTVLANGAFTQDIYGTVKMNLTVYDSAGQQLGSTQGDSINSPLAGEGWQAVTYTPSGYMPSTCEVEPVPAGSGPAELNPPA